MRASLVPLAVLALAAPASGQPAERARAPEQRAAPPDAGWSPLDRHGWPRGVPLEAVRGLPRCRPGEALPPPGERLECRPSLSTSTPQWALGIDWTGGVVWGDAPVTGSSHALGVQLDFGLTRAIQLGARWQLTGMGLDEAAPRSRTLPMGAGHRLFGQARYRIFVDEASRSALVLGAGAGYALQDDALGGDAPIARLSLAREVGTYLGRDQAMTAAFEVAYEATLGDARLSALLASLRLGLENNIREPANLGSARRARGPRYFASGDAYLGPVNGVGYGVGVPVTNHLALTTTASFMFGYARYDERDSLASQWAIQTGPRLSAGQRSGTRSGRPSLYAQLQAGPAWLSSDGGPEVVPVADLESGLMLSTCEGSVDVGIRLRADVSSGVDVVSGSMILRVTAGALRRTSPARCGHRPAPVAYMPLPPQPSTYALLPPPPPMDDEPGPGDEVDRERAPEIGVAVAVEVVPEGSIEVAVEVAVEPVVIEVQLGVVALGGLVEVHIDPSLVPLRRLRATGAIEIELRGPADALPAFEASLAGLLHREGIAVDAWSRVPAGGRRVRATITLWPPGARR
jgi:hypothetical protein